MFFQKVWKQISYINPVESGKITGRLWAVKTGTVNFFLYQVGDSFVCFDTGFHTRTILNQFKQLDIDSQQISHVFLTHSDFDHASGLPLFSDAKVYLSVEEEQMINGRTARFWGVFHNARINRDHQLLQDGEVVTIGSTTVRAVSTPGHTPGCMSYLVDDSILMVGDTFKLINQKVFPLRSYINMDTDLQIQSIRKLACLKNVVLVCTGHCGISTDFAGAFQDWLPHPYA